MLDRVRDQVAAGLCQPQPLAPNAPGATRPRGSQLHAAGSRERAPCLDRIRHQLRDVDRTLTLTSTVKGTPRVVVQVVLRDSAAVSTPIGTLAGVDVLSWVYQR